MNSREILRRLMMYFGWLPRACIFISPCSPYLAFRAKVCHTRTDAATSPNPMQNHWFTPDKYIITKSMKRASSPPTNMNRYCAFSPLNSTDFPIPLLIGNSAIPYIIRRMSGGWWRLQSGRYTRRTSLRRSCSYRDRPKKTSQSSRQREFHPKPLTEPYVKVSSHTALLIQPNCVVHYFRFRFLSLAVGLTPQAQCANRLGFCKAISPNLCTVAVLRFLKPLNFLRPQRTSLSLTC